MNSNLPQNNFTDFAENLIKEKNFPELTTETHDQIKKEILEKLDQTIKIRLADALPKAKLKEFMDLLDKTPPPAPETTQKFISDNIPNLDFVLGQILLDFRKTYLGLD
jgi:hypothetical protein